MKIATISLNTIWEDKQANLNKFRKILFSLTDVADYVIFPEMTLTGFSLKNMKLAENINSSVLLRELAIIIKESGLNVLFGMLTESEGKLFNSCIGISSSGVLEPIYNKIHLFSFSGEDKTLTPGEKAISIPWEGSWGLSICYDLRFPELYQKLSLSSLILVNIANWPSSRVLHWKTLLKARAIENQSFMIGVNRTGFDGNNLKYEESSVVFSPLGMELEPYIFSRDIKIFSVDKQLAIEARKSFGVKADRREDLYSNWHNYK